MVLGVSVVTVIFSIITWCIYKKVKIAKKTKLDRTANLTDLNEICLLGRDGNGPWDGSGNYHQNSSGRGPPYLNRRTIAKEIRELSYVGHGRYGKFYK